MNSLQQQIDEAHEEMLRLHLESVRCKQAWHIAEELHAGACGRLGQLLDEQKRSVVTEQEHNAFPGGRW